jgi:hypothetical protein
MRRYTSLLLLGMVIATAALVWVQREGDAAPPAGSAEARAGSAGTGSAAAGTGAGSAGAGASSASASAGSASAGSAATRPPPLRRALRTVALGWELLAPGVVAGDDAYKAAGLEAGFANATSMDEVESALAKGGGESGGADLAIVPLASYVASYEKLRALAPEVVLVVGWSRGREALFADNPRALAKPPAGAVKLAGAAGTTETFFGLVLLDLAGVPASRVELVDPDARAAPAPPALRAVLRGAKQRPPGKLLATTADTPNLMPLVAVAPHGFIAEHAGDLEAWARVWLAGVRKLQSDVPAAARKVAAQPGAPAVVALIEALGQLELASLRENAAAAGLSGRGALTLDELFRTAWRIWRDAGVLTTPPPDAAPLYPGLVAALVRADPSAAAALPRPRTAAAGGDPRPEILLAVRAPVTKDGGKLDAEAFVARIGFVAGVFDRLSLRISTRDGAKASQALADLARDRFGLRETQLSVSKRPLTEHQGLIEVASTM